MSMEVNSDETEVDASGAETTHRMNFDSVPHHLCQGNPLLSKYMQLIMPPNSSLEALREVALVMHKTMTITIVHALWIIYRKSGMGELPSPVSAYRGDCRVWPPEVRSLTKQLVELSVDDDACLRFVEHYLDDLREQHEQCQCDLPIKAQAVPGYTRIIDYALEKFVKQGLASLHVDIDRQIASVRYRYSDTILQRAYLATKPDYSQVSGSSHPVHDFLPFNRWRDLFKSLYQLKHDQAMAKLEVLLVKEKLEARSSVLSFDESLPSLDTIRDPRLRETLYEEYKSVSGQARNTMMAMYLKCAEKQQQQCQLDFDAAMADTLDRQQTLPFDEKLTPYMCELLEKRLANVGARLECDYKFKIDLFHISQS